MDNKTLSIIIPAYNEEKRIGATLKDYATFFKNIKHEIIVVLNGCVDNTEQVVKEYMKEHPSIKYITSKTTGKGNAVLEGARIAQGDFISFVDADNATKPPQIGLLMNHLQNHDAVIGSRWMKGSIILTPQPAIRKFVGRGFNFLVRIILGLNFSDTQCGSKIFKRKAIKSVVPSLKTRGWAMDVAILYRMKKKGFKVKEIPIIWKEPGGTVLKMRKAVPEMFLTLIKLRFNL